MIVMVSTTMHMKARTCESLKKAFIFPPIALRYKTNGSPPTIIKIIATISVQGLLLWLKELSNVEYPPVAIVVRECATASNVFSPVNI